MEFFVTESTLYWIIVAQEFFLEGKYVWGEKKFENIKKRLRMKKLFVERKTFEKNKWSLGRKVKSLEKNSTENG